MDGCFPTQKEPVPCGRGPASVKVTSGSIMALMKIQEVKRPESQKLTDFRADDGVDG
jgi:hypothetical protein